MRGIDEFIFVRKSNVALSRYQCGRRILRDQGISKAFVVTEYDLRGMTHPIRGPKYKLGVRETSARYLPINEQIEEGLQDDGDRRVGKGEEK